MKQFEVKYAGPGGVRPEEIIAAAGWRLEGPFVVFVSDVSKRSGSQVAAFRQESVMEIREAKG